MTPLLDALVQGLLYALVLLVPALVMWVVGEAVCRHLDHRRSLASAERRLEREREDREWRGRR